jgi:SP family general alpha glucoside:H+ symporter-like MFS transporter
MTGAIFVIFFAVNVQMLFIGEILCGLPWGAFSSSAVSYASDVTPVPLRGYLTTYVNLCWIIGQVLAAGILYRVLALPGALAYQVAFAVQWVWPIPLFILVTLAPESPWYLVRKGRLEDAKRSVARLQSKNSAIDPADTVAMMVRTDQFERDHETGSSYLACFRGADLRRTEISAFAWVSQVLCGMAFAGAPIYFFKQAGLSEANAFQLNLGVTFMALAGTLASWVALTFGGRRTFFVGGMATMCALLVIIGGLSWATSPNVKWAQAALIMLFVWTYDFTVGPLTYCIVGETSSTRLRSKTVGLARNAYNVTSIVGGILNTYMMNPLAWNWKSRAALFWAGTCLVMTAWAYFRLPEMKGRSYHQLDLLFERRIPARKFKETVITEEDEV